MWPRTKTKGQGPPIAALGSSESDNICDVLLEVLAGIDGALRLLDPAAVATPLPAGNRKAGTVAARGGSRFAKGECLALARQALREAARPLTTTELVRALLAKKSLPANDENSVRLSLRYAMGKGADGTPGGTGIVAADPQGTFPRWVLAAGVEQSAE